MYTYYLLIMKGKKTPIITCTYSRDGKYIAGAGIDGSIAMWKGDGPFVSDHVYTCTCSYILIII